jgi:hypothetical protein
MTNVWERTDINPTQKLVLLALADWANDEGLCWPSIERLCQKSGLKRRSVQMAIHAMEEQQILQREEVVGKGCKYWILSPVQEMHPRTKCTPPMQHMHPTSALDAPNTSITHQLNANKDMSSDDDALTVDDVVEAWNELAERRSLPRVAKLTTGRRKQIQSLIREYSVDDWSTAMIAINNSKFLCGDNERGWKANFDFLLQPKSFVKLIEGAYNK